MNASNDSRNEMVDGLLGPTGFEVTCEQCFELLDQYVDLEVKGEDADSHLPGLRTHLKGCPACHEDYESLRALVLDDSR
jgi:hypothetical protein